MSSAEPVDAWVPPRSVSAVRARQSVWRPARHPRPPEGIPIPLPIAPPPSIRPLRFGAGAPDAESAPDSIEARLLDLGPDRLQSAELLALLIGGRGRERDEALAARNLLQRCRSLRRAATATVAELQTLGQLPAGAATRVAAAFALGRRVAAERWTKGAPFKTSLDIFERYHALLRDARKERFLAVLLDGKNRVMRAEEVSEGTLTTSLVHPREAFAPAMREAASALVFVHNHPSGDPEPSPEDMEITRRLCACGELLGIRVLDHVVIGDGAFVSFLDRGWIHR